MRLVSAMLAAVAETSALLIGVIAVFRFGPYAGLVMAVILSFAAPVAVAIGVQRLARPRWTVSPWIAAVPVWFVEAGMSRSFTSFWVFTHGDAVEWGSFAIVAAAAALGGAMATRPNGPSAS